MIVTGIIANPTAARVSAPVSKFSTGERTGRLLLVLLAAVAGRDDEGRDSALRTELRQEKYSADPTPVRTAEGSVPRQKARTGDGECEIVRIVCTSVAVAVVPDAGGLCWRRVLRRSAGCRRTAERTPETPPERKWDFLRDDDDDGRRRAGVRVVIVRGAG